MPSAPKAGTPSAFCLSPFEPPTSLPCPPPIHAASSFSTRRCATASNRPGASMNLDEKLEVAQALVDLGVDVIEAGFPIASPGDFEAVREIARNVRGATICGLARCNDKDIDRAWEALQARRAAADPRLPGHQRDPPRVQAARWTRRRSSSGPSTGVKRAAGYCDDVEFSPEDAARTELDFLCRGGRGGDRRRRHDGQHPRHGRLRHAGPHAATSSTTSSTACRTSTRP